VDSFFWLWPLHAAADAKQFLEDYDSREIVAHLSFSEEFAARSWAQVSGSHANGTQATTDDSDRDSYTPFDTGRLEEVCSEAEMRRGLRRKPSLVPQTKQSLLTASRDHRFVCAPVRRLRSSSREYHRPQLPTSRPNGHHRFIHSHHDRETSHHWPTVSPEGRLTLPCLAKTYAK
jgi:hypothetical protein